MKKAIYTIALFSLFAVSLSACNVKSIPTLDKVTSDEIQFSGIKTGDTLATIKTDMGDIKIVLYPDLAPIAVENFTTHAKNGYYDGLIFHRVIEGFMIQSGDPLGNGTGGDSIWNLPFNDEFQDQLHHYTGALSMANSGANTNKSQFFIVTQTTASIKSDTVELMTTAGWREGVIDAYKQAGGAPNLDYRHTVFGQVYEGLDIAFEISRAKTGVNDKPKTDIIINTIEISTAE